MSAVRRVDDLYDSQHYRKQSTGEGTIVPFDFWKCEKCGRLCTALEMAKALGISPTASCCPCGSLKYSPMNLPTWGWCLPRVWRFAIQRLRGLA